MHFRAATSGDASRTHSLANDLCNYIVSAVESKANIENEQLSLLSKSSHAVLHSEMTFNRVDANFRQNLRSERSITKEPGGMYNLFYIVPRCRFLTKVET